MEMDDDVKDLDFNDDETDQQLDKLIDDWTEQANGMDDEDLLDTIKDDLENLGYEPSEIDDIAQHVVDSITNRY